MWDGKYGPLNAEQWDYAGEIVCHALAKAGERQDVGERYAWFEQELTTLTSHDKVHAGFRSRATEDDGAFVDGLGEVYEAVPVA